MMQKRALLVVCLLSLGLAGCGGEEVPRSGLPLVPIGAEQGRPAAGPAPTVAARDAALPGRLLFARAGDLWLWQGDAGHQITSRGDLTQPAWSPDGGHIAAVRRAESSSDIVLLAPDGSETAQITRSGTQFPPHSYERIYNTTWSLYPTFAPDGAEIAFAAQPAPPFGSPAADYFTALYTAQPLAGGGRSLRFAPAEGNVGRTAWSPDGGAIVFAYSPAAGEPPHLLRFDRRTGSVAPPQGVPEQSYDPAFSPDGRWLAFAARDAGRTDLFVVSAAGGAPLRLTSLGTARAPAFSPDGTRLAFLAVAPGENRFDLWALALSPEADALRAGAPRRLTEGAALDADAGLSWGP